MMTRQKKVVVKRQSEKCWPAFPQDHPFLTTFRDYGQSRSQNEELQVSMEDSTYLHYGDPSQLQQLFLNGNKVYEYFQALESKGLKVCPQNSKLCRLKYGIEFSSLTWITKAC